MATLPDKKKPTVSRALRQRQASWFVPSPAVCMFHEPNDIFPCIHPKQNKVTVVAFFFQICLSRRLSAWNSAVMRNRFLTLLKKGPLSLKCLSNWLELYHIFMVFIHKWRGSLHMAILTFKQLHYMLRGMKPWNLSLNIEACASECNLFFFLV